MNFKTSLATAVILILCNLNLYAQTRFRQIAIPTGKTYTASLAGKLVLPDNEQNEATGIIFYYDDQSHTKWTLLKPGEEVQFTPEKSAFAYAGFPYHEFDSRRKMINGEFELSLISSDNSVNISRKVHKDHAILIRDGFKTIDIIGSKVYTVSVSGEVTLPDNGSQPADGVVIVYDDRWHTKWTLLKPGEQLTFDQQNWKYIFAGILYKGDANSITAISGGYDLHIVAEDSSEIIDETIGRNETMLVNPTSSETDSGKVSLIAFMTQRDGNQEIYLMNGDGTDQVNLTRDPANDSFPVISPDGTKIAFGSDRTGVWELYTMALDGSNVEQLTSSLMGNFASPGFYGLDWHPDGSKLIVCARRDNPDMVWLLYEIDSDGSNFRLLIDDVVEDGRQDVQFARYSIDGSRIYMNRVVPFNGYTKEIYSSRQDGSDMTRLTMSANGEENPGSSSSPFEINLNGSPKILFTRVMENGNEIFMMNPDGSEEINLTLNNYHDWSAIGARGVDGTFLFLSNRDGIANIYKMRVDGAELKQLTFDYGSAPSWWVGLPSNKALTISLNAPIVSDFGNNIFISSKIEKESLNSANLFYRIAGHDSFKIMPLIRISGSNTYEATIPSEEVGTNGLEYYVKVTDFNGNSETSDLRAIQVRYPENHLATTITDNDTMKYLMLSVPVQVRDQSIETQFIDDIGIQNQRNWRLWDIDPERSNSRFPYREYPSVRALAPGNAYFFITAHQTIITAGVGVSVNSVQPFEILLQPGWNMISSPFNFNIPKTNVYPENLRTQLNAYSDIGWTTEFDSLQAWSGYMLKVNEAVTLQIDPQVHPLSGTQALTKLNVQPDWFIRVAAKCGKAQDTDNIAGVSSLAEPEWDRFERFEPPPIGDYVMLSFPHRNWQKYPDIHATDFRPAGETGYVWDFEVSSNQARKEVELKFANQKSLPKNFTAVLYDPDLAISQVLAQDSTYRFPALSGMKKKRLQLIAGTDEFITRQTVSASAIPEKFELSQNFPNPFNPSTTIKFGLPEASHVSLKIYNILGQEVKSLLSEQFKEAGFHLVNWHGNNISGKPVSSGIYLIQITTDNKTLTRKMTLLR